MNKTATAYKQWLIDLKQRIRQSQIKAAVRVNTELLHLYWDLGQDIVVRQMEAAWGSRFFEQLSKDLALEFPDMKGFSERNLLYMKRFYQFYTEDNSIRPQVVDEIPQQLAAELQTADNKDTIIFQQLASEIIKDPYNFDFLTLTENFKEKELEDALTTNITNFLLELGQSFAYIGRQVPVKIGETERFIDLLFYHLDLRCFVVIELKAGKFEAEHIGKLGLYISAINHQKKKDTDSPTIGMIICKTKDNVEVQYSLEIINQPIGVSEYKLSKLLPKHFKSALPSIEEIEKRLKDTDILK